MKKLSSGAEVFTLLTSIEGKAGSWEQRAKNTGNAEP